MAPKKHKKKRQNAHRALRTQGQTGLFGGWHQTTQETIRSNSLTIFELNGRKETVNAIAQKLPTQYVSNARYAGVLKRLGKTGAAKYLRNKIPRSKTTRSGELGEVLALTFVEEETKWNQTVKRLRWKDHRDMPMRGDDVLAVGLDGGRVLLLKGEAKSRAKLSNRPLQQAQSALETNEGLPSPHTLAFYSDRLHGEGSEELADAIDRMQYRDGIPKDGVSHMIFAFSGNDPKSLMQEQLKNYDGGFEQIYVGAHVGEHSKFVRKVFKTVVRDGDT